VRAYPVVLDFAAPRFRISVLGMGLLVVGLAALVASCLEYRIAAQRRAGLELKLAATSRRPVQDPAKTQQNARLNEAATDVARQLGKPWTAVLADLEAASHASQDQIAVLSIEPDADKHRVRITAESRDLPPALAYLNRLQASSSLRYPMLDSHEIVADNSEHPVRFAMTADWREAP
jgi:hypothetical protein